MEKKELEITCPCCSSRLLVDVRTGQLLRTTRPEELDESGKPKVGERDWASASDKVEGRLASAEDKFDASLARERERSQSLDDLFRKANEKIKEGEDED